MQPHGEERLMTICGNVGETWLVACVLLMTTDPKSGAKTNFLRPYENHDDTQINTNCFLCIRGSLFRPASSSDEYRGVQLRERHPDS